MEIKYFKYQHYIFSALCTRMGKCTLWASNSPKLIYLGRIEFGMFYKTDKYKTLEWSISKGLERLLDNVIKDEVIAGCSGKCYSKDMDKKEYKKLLLELIDGKKYSIRKTAILLNKSPSAIHEAYHREKNGVVRVRSGYPQLKLASVRVKR